MPPRSTRLPSAEAGASAAAGLREGALADLVGYRLKRAHMRFRGSAIAALAPHDVRLLPLICLAVIVANPGVSPSDLSEMLGIERPNMVVFVDELESRDLVTRSPSRTDRRRITLMATVKGRRLHDRAVADIKAQDQRMMAALSPEERIEFARMLHLVQD